MTKISISARSNQMYKIQVSIAEKKYTKHKTETHSDETNKRQYTINHPVIKKVKKLMISLFVHYIKRYSSNIK